jgi:hypothetical protein
MGIYDDPRYGVTALLMRQRGGGGGGQFGAGMSNGNSLFGGVGDLPVTSAPTPASIGGLGGAMSGQPFGMMGGGGPPGPYGNTPPPGASAGLFGGGPLGVMGNGAIPQPPAGGWPQGQIDAGTGSGFPMNQTTQQRGVFGDRPQWNPITGVSGGG